MDIVLKRILTLIPKKENGDFKHGALKAFANSIGLKSGNLISDWINERSKSYENYIYQIATIYNVSVEWLKGETDGPTPKGQKEKPTPNNEGELSELEKTMLSLFRQISDEEQSLAVQIVRAMAKKLESL